MEPVGGDQIEIRGLRVVGICGALPEERTRPQPLEVDLDLTVDLAAAGRSDALDDTVDYGQVCDSVAAAVGSGDRKLLEHLAAQLADVVLEVDGRIAAVTVAVRKLRPPVPHDVDTTGVRITRSR